MNDQRLDQLSERQKQCLRLKYANLETKEIARELELSPHTVSEHLRDARKVLGVSRSMHAARLLVAHEGDNRLVSAPLGVASHLDLDDETRATESEPPATVARNRYNLGVLQRIGLIVAIAFGAMALAGALLGGAEAITRIFRAEQIDISDFPYR